MRKFLAFAWVSGLGLTLDVAIYAALCASGMQAGYANLISAAVGVTFVFFVASRKVFVGNSGGWLLGPFAVYVAYQVVAIAAASWAVDAFTDLFGGRYLLGKAAVLPLTLSINFLVSQRLLSPR